MTKKDIHSIINKAKNKVAKKNHVADTRIITAQISNYFVKYFNLLPEFYNEAILECAYGFLEIRLNGLESEIDKHTVGEYSKKFWSWWLNEWYRVDKQIYNEIKNGKVYNLRYYILRHLSTKTYIDNLVYKPNKTKKNAEKIR